MDVWVPLLSGFAGGALAIVAATITQLWTNRRERLARAWNRRADIYVALMRWRLDPPPDEKIANPRELQERTDDWKEQCRPIFAELVLFGGPARPGLDAAWLLAVVRNCHRHLVGP